MTKNNKKNGFRDFWIFEGGPPVVITLLATPAQSSPYGRIAWKYQKLLTFKQKK